MMHFHDHDQPHLHHHDNGGGGLHEDLDPAQRSLAEALRKSFGILKLLMLVMIVAYVLSGWFRVQPGEVGFVVRTGRVAGDRATRVLRPGWHWAFPYPIDEVVTVATQMERVLPVSFMFHVTEEERMRGMRRTAANPLNPRRDDYLITGDTNILHARMVARYRISDPVSYIANLHDSTPGDTNPPEFETLGNLVRRAAIRVAAARGVRQIYGEEQSEFLNLVTEASRSALRALETSGAGLGIEIVAVIAPQVAGVEAILPPRQVQEEFDRVLSAEQQKVRAISEAEGVARQRLNRAAGAAYGPLAAAIDEEFEALLAYLAAGDPNGLGEGNDVVAKRAELERRRQGTNELLLQTSGEVQRVINRALSDRDRLVTEAEADYERLRRLESEYRRDGKFLIARLQTEFVSRVLSDDRIQKWFVPQGKEIRLMIPREPDSDEKTDGEHEHGKGLERREGFIERGPRIIGR
jgi:membrane protease subunit HflK